MTTRYTMPIDSELAKRIAPYLTGCGYNIDNRGEVFITSRRDFRIITSIIDALSAQDCEEADAREPVKQTFRLEGYQSEAPKPSPIDALRKRGITVSEGEPLVIHGDRGFETVRGIFAAATAELPEGHGWRLFALLDESAKGGSAMRVTVGRADAWPFPSASEAPKAEGSTATVTGPDLMRSVLEKATEASAPAGDFDKTSFAASRAVDVKLGTVNFLARGEAPKAEASVATIMRGVERLCVATEKATADLVEFTRAAAKRMAEIHDEA